MAGRHLCVHNTEPAAKKARLGGGGGAVGSEGVGDSAFLLCDDRVGRVVSLAVDCSQMHVVAIEELAGGGGAHRASIYSLVTMRRLRALSTAAATAVGERAASDAVFCGESAEVDADAAKRGRGGAVQKQKQEHAAFGGALGQLVVTQIVSPRVGLLAVEWQTAMGTHFGGQLLEQSAPTTKLAAPSFDGRPLVAALGKRSLQVWARAGSDQARRALEAAGAQGRRRREEETHGSESQPLLTLVSRAGALPSGVEYEELCWLAPAAGGCLAVATSGISVVLHNELLEQLCEVSLGWTPTALSATKGGLLAGSADGYVSVVEVTPTGGRKRTAAEPAHIGKLREEGETKNDEGAPKMSVAATYATDSAAPVRALAVSPAGAVAAIMDSLSNLATLNFLRDLSSSASGKPGGAAAQRQGAEQGGGGLDEAQEQEHGGGSNSLLERGRMQYVCGGFHHDGIVAMDIVSQQPLAVSVSDDRWLRAWDYAEGRCLMARRFDARLSAVAVHPSGLLCAVGVVDSVSVVHLVEQLTEGEGGSDAGDGASGGTPPIVVHSASDVSALAFSHGGHLLAALCGASCVLWRTYSRGGALAVLRRHHGPAAALAFSPGDDRLATAGSDGRVNVWELGAQMGVAAAETESAGTAPKPADDKHGGAKLAQGGEWSQRGCSVSALAFAGGGDSLVAAVVDAKGETSLVALLRGVVALRVPVHGCGVTGLSLPCGGRVLMAATTLGTVRTWPWREHDGSLGGAAAVAAQWNEFGIHVRAISALAVAPGGRQVLTGGVDGSIYVSRAQYLLDGISVAPAELVSARTASLVVAEDLERLRERTAEAEQRAADVEGSAAYNELLAERRVAEEVGRVRSELQPRIGELEARLESLRDILSTTKREASADRDAVLERHAAEEEELQSRMEDKLAREGRTIERLRQQLEESIKLRERNTSEAAADLEAAVQFERKEAGVSLGRAANESKLRELASKSKGKVLSEHIQQLEQDVEAEVSLIAAQRQEAMHDHALEKDDLRARIHMLGRKKDALRETISKNEKALGAADRRVQALARESKEQQAVIGQLKEQAAKVDDVLVSKDQEMAQLRLDCKQLETHKFILERHLEEARAANEPLEARITEMTANIKAQDNVLLHEVTKHERLLRSERAKAASAQAQAAELVGVRARMVASERFSKCMMSDLAVALAEVVPRQREMGLSRLFTKYNTALELLETTSSSGEGARAAELESSEAVQTHAQLQRAAAAERRSTAFKAKKSMRETKRLLEENQTLLAMNAELRREIKEMKVNAAAIQRTGGATAAGASAPTRGMHPSSAGGSRPSSAASTLRPASARGRPTSARSSRPGSARSLIASAGAPPPRMIAGGGFPGSFGRPLSAASGVSVASSGVTTPGGLLARGSSSRALANITAADRAAQLELLGALEQTEDELHQRDAEVQDLRQRVEELSRRAGPAAKASPAAPAARKSIRRPMSARVGARRVLLPAQDPVPPRPASVAQ